MLPFESEVRAEIQRDLSEELSLLDGTIAESIRIVTTPLTFGKKAVGTDKRSFFVALGLIVKAIKQARTVYLLSKSGLGEDAHANARNLLETTVATQFILRSRVKLKRNGKPLSAIKGFPLSSSFRAKLYLANVAFEGRRTIENWSRTRGVKRVLKKSERDAILHQANQAEKQIGPEWTARLKERKSYSGLTLRDLAVSLDFEQVYVTIYRSASWTTHAGDIASYLAPGDEPTVYITPGTKMVRESLRGASLCLPVLLSSFNERFGFDTTQN